MAKKWKETLLRFVKNNKWILIIMLFLFLERLYALYRLGIHYSLESDDLTYVLGGIEFANTGAITTYGIISAQYMPGITYIIGIVSLLFGEGTLFWLALKLVWIIMGVWTAFFVYKSVNLFAPKWCGLLVSLLFFAPNFVWMDNVILAETPFILFLTIMIYCTLMMGKTHKRVYFWACTFSYLLALMLRANIGFYPLFAFVYLLLVKYDFKTLLKQGLILACVVLCFIVPWTIRNYIQFETFVPLTYGAGNPMLLGTYQGEGYPEDEWLDYETNVEQVLKEEYEHYFNADGTYKKDYYWKYLELERDGIKAKYRLSEWIKSNPKSVIKSYLYLKPKEMLQSSFYWKPIMGTSVDSLLKLSGFELILFFLSIAAAFLLKRRRAAMLFLSSFYLVSIYVYATTFAYSRYAVSLITPRYIAIGIGLCLFVELIQKAFRAVREFNKNDVPAGQEPSLEA